MLYLHHKQWKIDSDNGNYLFRIISPLNFSCEKSTQCSKCIIFVTNKDGISGTFCAAQNFYHLPFVPHLKVYIVLGDIIYHTQKCISLICMDCASYMMSQAIFILLCVDIIKKILCTFWCNANFHLFKNTMNAILFGQIWSKRNIFSPTVDFNTFNFLKLDRSCSESKSKISANSILLNLPTMLKVILYISPLKIVDYVVLLYYFQDVPTYYQWQLSNIDVRILIFACLAMLYQFSMMMVLIFGLY